MKEFLISRIKGAEDLPLPCYMTKSAAGMDLYANVDEPVTLSPGQRRLVPSGIKLALPEGFEAQIRPRSGLALKHGITLLNSPGTIDADYRGEVGVILINLGEQDFTFSRGERIAQMVITPIHQVKFNEVGEDKLPDSNRGSGGFGSTGRG